MKKAVKHVLSAIALSTFIVLGAGSVDTDQGAKNVASKPAAFFLTADDLYQAYEQNSVAADAKYEGKVVEISGTIQSIGKDITDTAYLVVGGDGFLDGVQCMLPKGQEDLVARVSKGQYVTLKGEVSGKMGNVLVRNCSFSG